MRLIDGNIQAMFITNFILERKEKIIDILQKSDNDYLFALMMNYFDEQPTAYSVENVVEELEELKTRYFLTIANTGDEKSDFAYENVGNALDKAIEIVKQGGVTKNCNNCANYTESDEIDNGCYLCCKGYENNYKPKVDNDGMSDDVCEYKEQKNKFGQHIFITSCGKDLIQYGFMFEYNYCPYCGKKIKIVGD